jgi:hypothetical protein
LGAGGRDSLLREVPIKELTMKRRFDLVCRRDADLSPAALRLIAVLRTRGKALFEGR